MATTGQHTGPREGADPPGGGPVWFRAALALAAVVAGILAASLATHRSGSSAILGRYSLPFFGMLLAVGGTAIFLVLAQWGPLFRALRRVRYQILLLVVTLGLTLFVFEGFLRLVDPIGISWYQESNRYQQRRIPDPDLVYRHPPHLEERYQGVTVKLNELGLRERPIGPKAPDEFRVLILGDSITFGWGVEVEDTFSRKLETELEGMLGRPVRTINAGVGSYNTSQELAFLLRHGESLDPDLVLLVYHPNDVNRSQSPEVAERERSFSGKKPHQQLGLLLRRLWTYRLAVHVYGGYTGGNTPRPEAPGWQESMGSLGRIAARCREMGLPFAAFFWRVAPGPVNEVLDRDISAVAEREGFPYGDMMPFFQGKHPLEVTNSAVDIHPNVEGNALAARGMARFLEEQGLLQDAAGPGAGPAATP